MSRYIASRENMAGGLATIFIKLRLLNAQVKGIYTGQLIYEKKKHVISSRKWGHSFQEQNEFSMHSPQSLWPIMSKSWKVTETQIVFHDKSGPVA